MTSSSNKNIDSDKWVQWIEDGISKYYINCHEYDEFQDIERIGSGAFGEVSRATWKSTNSVVALKSFKNDSCIMKEIVNEVNNNNKILIKSINELLIINDNFFLVTIIKCSSFSCEYY